MDKTSTNNTLHVVANPKKLPATPHVFLNVKNEKLEHYNPPALFPVEEKQYHDTKQRVNQLQVFEILHQKKFLFYLKHPCEFFFFGKVKLKVVCGSVDILGYELTRDQEYEVFSPTTNSAICVSSTGTGDTKAKKLLWALFKTENVVSEGDKQTLLNLHPTDCVLIVEEIETKISVVVEKYLGIQVFPKAPLTNTELPVVSNALNCQLSLKSGRLESIKKSEEWDQLNVTESKCTVLCGGKNIGKSTLGKYLVNKCLKKYNSVLWIELDPGQPEFTPPGILSVVRVQKPLLGASFTHTTEPDICFSIGEVDIAQCPSKYLECVKRLANHCRAEPEYATIPWFVNTMGFCKGLGVALMLDVLFILQPDNLIQISSQDKKKNYPFVLTSSMVLQNKRLLFSKTKRVGHLSYRHQQIDCLTDGVKIRAQPKNLRNIMLVSYLSRMMAAPYYSLNAVEPYSIHLSKLYLYSNPANAFEDVLKVYNGSLVALCHFEQEDGQFYRSDNPRLFQIVTSSWAILPCYGLGFVRFIDMSKSELFLLTHLPNTVLDNINCLQVGALTPPASLYTQQVVDGPVPYTTNASEDANMQNIKNPYKLTPQKYR